MIDSTLWVTNGPVTAIARSGNTVYLGGDFLYLGPWTGGGVPLSNASGTALPPFPKVGGLGYRRSAAASNDDGSTTIDIGPGPRGGRGRGLDPKRARQGRPRLPAALQPAAAALRQDLATERGRADRVNIQEPAPNRAHPGLLISD